MGRWRGKHVLGLEQRLELPDSESGLRLLEEAAYSQTAADVRNFQSAPAVCPKGLHPHFNCRKKPFWAFDFISKFWVFTGRTALSVKYFNISLKSYKDQGVLFFPCNPSSSLKFIAMCLKLWRKKIGPGALRFSASSRGALTDRVCVTWPLCFSDRCGLVQHGQSATVLSMPSSQASSPWPCLLWTSLGKLAVEWPEPRWCPQARVSPCPSQLLPTLHLSPFLLWSLWFSCWVIRDFCSRQVLLGASLIAQLLLATGCHCWTTEIQERLPQTWTQHSYVFKKCFIWKYLIACSIKVYFPKPHGLRVWLQEGCWHNLHASLAEASRAGSSQRPLLGHGLKKDSYFPFFPSLEWVNTLRIKVISVLFFSDLFS